MLSSLKPFLGVTATNSGMPFIDGETLRDKLNRETQLGIEEAVRITCDVADALDYAHRNNVIHQQ